MALKPMQKRNKIQQQQEQSPAPPPSHPPHQHSGNAGGLILAVTLSAATFYAGQNWSQLVRRIKARLGRDSDGGDLPPIEEAHGSSPEDIETRPSATEAAPTLESLRVPASISATNHTGGMHAKLNGITEEAESEEMSSSGDSNEGLRQNLESAEARAAQSQEQVEALQQRNTKVELELTSLTDTLEQQKTLIDRQAQRVTRAERVAEELSGKLASVAGTSEAGAKEKLEAAEQRAHEAEERCSALEKESASLRYEHAGADAKMSNAAKEAEQGREAASAAQQELKTLEAELKSAEQKMKALEDETSSLQNKLRAAEGQVRASKDNMRRMDDRMRGILKERSEMSTQLKHLTSPK